MLISFLLLVKTCNIDGPLVYGLFVFEWVQTGLITSTTFDKMVYHYGDLEHAIKFNNTWFSVPVMCGVVSTAVQMLYARRILILSESRKLAFAISVVSRNVS